MKRALLVFAVIGVICAGSLQAAPVSYVGKLACTSMGGSGDGSLFASGDWLSKETTLSWKVDNVTTPGMWHYEYTIVTPNVGGLPADIQCVIIEASNGLSGEAFTMADLSNLSSSPDGWIQTIGVGTHSPSDNPNLSGNLYGIRLATVSIDPKVLTIRFDTERAPVWGDFYASSHEVAGEFSSLTNWDLMRIVESDPSDLPSSGSIKDHVLVPDSVEDVEIAAVPAPGALLLCACGASVAGWLRHKRRL